MNGLPKITQQVSVVSGFGTQVSLSHKLAPFPYLPLTKNVENIKKGQVERRVQNGKMVHTGSNSSSCGQAKSLARLQFPQLYSKLLGPFGCHVLSPVTRCLLEMFLSFMVEMQRKVIV